MTSVCLSVCLFVTLVDCDHIVQQRVKIGACIPKPPSQIVVSSDAEFKPRRRCCRVYLCLYLTDNRRNLHREYHANKAEFCTLAAIISAPIGSRVALSQHLLSFLFNFNDGQSLGRYRGVISFRLIPNWCQSVAFIAVTDMLVSCRH